MGVEKGQAVEARLDVHSLERERVQPQLTAVTLSPAPIEVQDARELSRGA